MLSLRTIRAFPQIWVAYPFAHFAKGWGVARSAMAMRFDGHGVPVHIDVVSGHRWYSKS
jgi:hypothetical protein